MAVKALQDGNTLETARGQGRRLRVLPGASESSRACCGVTRGKKSL